MQSVDILTSKMANVIYLTTSVDWNKKAAKSFAGLWAHDDQGITDIPVRELPQVL